jgi:hypothetical protein
MGCCYIIRPTNHYRRRSGCIAEELVSLAHIGKRQAPTTDNICKPHSLAFLSLVQDLSLAPLLALPKDDAGEIVA